MGITFDSDSVSGSLDFAHEASRLSGKHGPIALTPFEEKDRLRAVAHAQTPRSTGGLVTMRILTFQSEPLAFFHTTQTLLGCAAPFPMPDDRLPLVRHSAEGPRPRECSGDPCGRSIMGPGIVLAFAVIDRNKPSPGSRPAIASQVASDGAIRAVRRLHPGIRAQMSESNIITTNLQQA